MAIIRWNPWNISSLFDEEGFDLPTIPGFSRLGQGLNIFETKDVIVAEAALPGVPEDKIDVSVDERVVRISGSVNENKEEKGERRYYMSSMSSSYNYSFRLPESVAGDKEPTAEVENGVLILTFPKLAVTPPKKVKVMAKAKQSK